MRITVAVLSLLLLGACNVRKSSEQLAFHAVELGYACADHGITLDACKKMLREEFDK